MIEKLENIGFYTLSDERAATSSPTSQMQRAEMIITEECQFSCPYCRGLVPEIFGDKRQRQMSLEDVKKGIDYWCEGTPLKNIRFSGGEPTLHKNIIEIVEYAKFKGIERIAISTNGANRFDLYKQLIDIGCNDFSISLDACCSSTGDKMAGGVYGAWQKVVDNIKKISELTYVTVGVVLTPDNIAETIKTIELAHSLGVADIRIITAAQWSGRVDEFNNIPKEFLDKHPILKYRTENFKEGKDIRGIQETDYHKCGLVLDDGVIANHKVYPCIIYMRERGHPICEVGRDMRDKRVDWYKTHNTYEDPICRKNCLDVCRAINNKFRDTNSNAIL